MQSSYTLSVKTALKLWKNLDDQYAHFQDLADTVAIEVSVVSHVRNYIFRANILITIFNNSLNF